jgi:nicotinate phosphoribosyltransferase
MKQNKSQALFTDLYELTMAASYFNHSLMEPACFSLFVRDYPAHRSYFVSAGSAEVLDYLEGLSFTPDDLEYLESTRLFKKDFLSYLETLKFTGDVLAIPEGRIFFANEPILEVTAPLIEAQIIETFIINAINIQSMIATKASRCVHAAQGRPLVDFSLRRTQGTDAGTKVSRASFIGGFIGTSNVLAGQQFGIPIYGTMAHSFITSFRKEIDAFRAFVQTFPNNSVLLVDTYDTLSGARNAAAVGREMAQRGETLKGIRLDSGDMVKLSKEVRLILAEAGLPDTEIFASGAFDEYKIQNVLGKGAEIDSFGVGTKMGVSADAPFLDLAYKLVKYQERPVLKLSPGKIILTSDKQVFRFTAPDNHLSKDVIGLRDDVFEEAESLLVKMMENGKIVSPLSSLPQVQKTFLDEFIRLEDKYKSLEGAERDYPVSISPRLEKLQTETIQRVKEEELSHRR